MESIKNYVLVESVAMKFTAVPVAVMLLLTGILFVGCSSNTKEKTGVATPQCELMLEEVPVKEDKAAPAPPPDHKEVIAPTTAKVKFTKPKNYTIVSKVDPPICSEPPPPQPEKDYTDSLVFTKVEIEAEYPGGPAAWQRFLNRNLRYPQEAIDNEISGSVVVQFIVDKEGNVSNVERVSGPEILGEEAVRVIKKSGRWIPATQSGRRVKSLRKQPFVICFASEG